VLLRWGAGHRQRADRVCERSGRPLEMASSVLWPSLMRKELARTVRAEFDRLIKQDLHRFVRIRDPWADTGAIYRWSRGEKHAFLHLQMHSTWDWFNVECGVSGSDRFPAAARPVDPTGIPGTNDVRFRASRLWTNPPRDVWWELAKAPDPVVARAEDYVNTVPIAEALLRIPPAAADAVQKLRTYAVPFFERALP